MIPLGLKETKEVSFIDPFSDFILEHYSEDPINYEDAIADITDTRQVWFYIFLIFSLKIRPHVSYFDRPPEHQPEIPKVSAYCFVTTIYCTMSNAGFFRQIDRLAFTLNGLIH